METLVLPRPYDGKFCVHISNVFSKQECDALIARTEALGYVKATLGDGEIDEEYRNSDRRMIDDPELAAIIFERIRHAIPSVFKTRTCLGLNERLRFLRYNPGHFFRPHYDAAYTTREGDARSILTMMLYLSEDFDGGETAFLGGKDNLDPEVLYKPRIGSVLLFEHKVLHEGRDVTRGTKYAVRTDVMFSTTK